MEIGAADAAGMGCHEHLALARDYFLPFDLDELAAATDYRLHLPFPFPTQPT
jgi:hypothetical protein